MRLEELASIPARRFKATLLGATLAAAISLLFILRLSPDSSIQNMMPRGNPSAQAMGHVLKDFSAADQLLLLVSLPDEISTDRNSLLTDFAAQLTSAVKASPVANPLVEEVVYQADEKSKQFFMTKVAPAAIYYLSEDRYQQAKARLTKPQMQEQIRQDETLISTPGPAAGALASAFLQDPLRLHEYLLSEINDRKPAGFSAGSGGGFFSPDGRSLLIRVVGKKSLDDLEYAGRLTDAVTKLAADCNTSHLKLDISGGYAIASTSARSIRHDMIISVVSSVLLLQVLFVIAYRRPIRYFLLAFIPVGVGLLYGFGVRAMLWPVISPAAAVVGAVLAGMGIDYTVLYLPHYHAARMTGLGPIKAVGQTTSQLLSPLTAACITSVIGFAAVGWSSVPALRDFSVVGSLGLIGALLCSVTLMPALLTMTDRTNAVSAIEKARPRMRLEPLLDWLTHHRRKVYIIWAAVLGSAAIVVVSKPGPLMPMETDLTVMHPRPNKALDAESTIAHRMGTDPGAMAIYLHAESSDQLIELAYDVQQRLATAGMKRAGVVGVLGVSTLLPDPRVVRIRQAEVSAQRTEKVIADFQSTVAESSFDPAAFKNYEGFLRMTLNGPMVPTLADLANDPRISENFMSRDLLDAKPGAAAEALTLLFFDHPLDSRQQRQDAVNEIRKSLAGVSGATLTGLGVISLDTETNIQNDLPKLLLIALGLNVLYLLLHFRSVGSAMLAMIPTGVSLLLLAAFTRGTGQKLNLVNLIALPLLIGIAVDYGIYLVSLARPHGPIDAGESRRRVATSGYSVMISAAANVLGFGSLMSTSVPAIQSLGWSVGIGVAGCCAGTLFLLAPLLMANHSVNTEVESVGI